MPALLHLGGHRLGFISPDGRDRPPHEILAMIQEYFASLPPERFPHTTAMAGHLTAGSPDERFAFGLEVIARGLASYVPAAAAGGGAGAVPTQPQRRSRRRGGRR